MQRDNCDTYCNDNSFSFFNLRYPSPSLQAMQEEDFKQCSLLELIHTKDSPTLTTHHFQQEKTMDSVLRKEEKNKGKLL